MKKRTVAGLLAFFGVPAGFALFPHRPFIAIPLGSLAVLSTNVIHQRLGSAAR